MKKLFLTLTLVIGIFANAFSQATSMTVDCQTPGWLSSMINYGDQMTLESLTVTGYINKADLKFIGSMIKKSLTSIDLSNAETPTKNLPEGMFGLDQVYTIKKLSLPINMVSGMNCLENIVTDTIICGSNSCNTIVISRNLAKQYIIREGVDSIGKRGVVFRYATSSEPGIIENVSLPTTLKYIHEKTFQNNVNIHYIDLPNSVEEIGVDAFRDTSWNLDTLVLPNSIKKFALTAFNSPSNVYYFPNGINYIDNTRVASQTVSGPSYEEFINFETTAVFHLKSSIPPVFNCLNNQVLSSSLVFVPKGTSSIYNNTVPWDKATIIEEIFVESISLENNKLLYVGDQYKMQAQIFPTDATNQKVKWESSNSDIVEISEEGILLAKTYGTAVITATTIDGGYTATCNVNVYEHTTGIEMIDIITIPVGETDTLRAQTLPLSTSDGKILYNSDNNSIASVNSEGIVVALKKGTCSITATTEDGGYSATCVVKVTQPVESLALESHSKTLKVGESEILYVQLLPTTADDKTVTWISSNQQIASVDAYGKVTAIKAGEAWISAVSNDNPEAKDSCTVTVIQPVTGITLSQTSCILTSIGESIQLEASVLPEDASNKEVRWSSSNEAICVASQGLVIATGFGTAVVFASSDDGGYMASCVVTVEEPSAIQDITNKEQEESPTYDLMGNKVQHTIKGHLYIRNGQKFLAK